MSCADSTNRGRASSIGMRKPAYSTLAAPRPKPNRQRPPHNTSSSAMLSATRIGSCHGSTITAVPECDALRAARKVAEQLHRCRRHRVAGEVMLQREDRIEAKRLGKIAKFKMFLVDGYIRSSRLRQDAQRNADLHGRLLHDWPECVRMRHRGRGVADAEHSGAQQRLPDLLRDGLDVVFIGINPSLLLGSARATTLPGARNRFWPCFSRSVLSAAARRALGVQQLEPEHDRDTARARLRLHRPGQAPHRARRRSAAGRN